MKIQLNFPDTVSALVGYEYGEKIYEEQVKEKIEWNEEIVIEFPDEIRSVAISFVQGFYNDIVQHLGFENAITKVKVEAFTPELEKKIQDSILSII